MKTALFALLTLATLAVSAPARAQNPSGVGLGIAAGLDYSTADRIFEDDSNTSFAWGFFVDIPLLDTFVISPQTTLYDLDIAVDDGSLEPGEQVEAINQAVTDVGLNFKFMIPLRSVSLGAGILAGATTGLGDYRLHYGALAQLNVKLLSNIDGFILAQFKRIDVGDELLNEDINKVHVFAGGMFRF